jgi:hypothetical protein
VHYGFLGGDPIEVFPHDERTDLRWPGQRILQRRGRELVNEGIRVRYTSIDGLAWAEIDDPQNLTFAQENIFPQLVTAAV